MGYQFVITLKFNCNCKCGRTVDIPSAFVPLKATDFADYKEGETAVHSEGFGSLPYNHPFPKASKIAKKSSRIVRAKFREALQQCREACEQ